MFSREPTPVKTAQRPIADDTVTDLGWVLAIEFERTSGILVGERKTQVPKNRIFRDTRLGADNASAKEPHYPAGDFSFGLIF